MNQGFITRIKAQLKAIQDYLKTNHDTLSQEDIDEALDEINRLKDLLEIFEES